MHPRRQQRLKVTIQMIMAEFMARAEPAISHRRATRGHKDEETPVLANQSSPMSAGQIVLVRVEDSLLPTDLLRIDWKDVYAAFVEDGASRPPTPRCITAP